MENKNAMRGLSSIRIFRRYHRVGFKHERPEKNHAPATTPDFHLFHSLRKLPKAEDKAAGFC
jgi:hypothetical protein